MEKVINLAFGLFFFLLPLYFLPISGTSVETDKQALLIFSALLLFFLFTLKVIIGKKITLVRTPVDLLILAFSAVFLLSTIFVSPNKTESLVAPLGAGTIFACTLLYFTLTHSINNQQLTINNLSLLLISSSLVSLLFLLQQLTINNFSPLGGLLPTFLFLTVIFVYLTTDLVLALMRKAKIFSKNIILKALAFFLIAPAIVLSAFHLATDQKPLLLPFSFGWSIMMEMYKNVSTFLLGVGPANFITAFTLGKPAALNLTPLWNAVAFTSTNLPLTLATEVGVVGGIIFLFLAVRTLRFLTRAEEELAKPKIPISKTVPESQFQPPLLLSLLTALALQFLFPSNVALLALTYVLFALAAPRWETKQLTINNQQLTMYFAAPILLVIILLFFFQSKIYLADIYYRRALSSANNQRVASAFDFSQQAISFNPASDRYYALSSSLALNIARNLASSPDATESAQQQNINRLTQQAVSHARLTTELNPQNGQNWAQLANVYQSLIGTITGVEQLALDSLNQQMRLDPVSPQPKLAAGGLLMSFGQFDQAQLLFTQAINLKPDWNNAHYNLATLYAQVKNYQAAAAELESTLVLTPSDSEDYKRVQKELEAIKALFPKEATSSTSLGTGPSAEATPSTSLGASPSAEN